MRFELAGTMASSGPPGPGNPSNPPVTILTYSAAATLNVKSYMDQGYTNFDVICIGGGGGQGGGIDGMKGLAVGSYPASPNNQKFPGGAGGGGGFHKVSGLLYALPDTVNVVVGSGGNPGTEDVGNPANTTDGSDGAASTFNATTCRASGGKGGKRVQTVTLGTANPLSDGGDGGLGNTTVAGGGGAGGKARTTTTNQINGATGTYDPTTGIGSGGGGGGGGTGSYSGGNLSADGPSRTWDASSGGGGSNNATDTSVYSPGSTPSSATAGYTVPNPGTIIPGYAGGAKAAPLSGLNTSYGDSAVAIPTHTNQFSLAYVPPQKGHDGVVVVLLSAK